MIGSRDRLLPGETVRARYGVAGRCGQTTSAVGTHLLLIIQGFGGIPLNTCRVPRAWDDRPKISKVFLDEFLGDRKRAITASSPETLRASDRSGTASLESSFLASRNCKRRTPLHEPGDHSGAGIGCPRRIESECFDSPTERQKSAALPCPICHSAPDSRLLHSQEEEDLGRPVSFDIHPNQGVERKRAELFLKPEQYLATTAPGSHFATPPTTNLICFPFPTTAALLRPPKTNSTHHSLLS